MWHIHPSPAHPQCQLARGTRRSLLAGSYRDCTAWNSFLTSLGGFRDIREEQCRTVHKKERTGMQMVWLPPGPQRDARDHRFQAMMLREGWDDEGSRMQWEEVGRIYGYNAREAVEDWWVSLGTWYALMSDCSRRNTAATMSRCILSYHASTTYSCHIMTVDFRLQEVEVHEESKIKVWFLCIDTILSKCRA